MILSSPSSEREEAAETLADSRSSSSSSSSHNSSPPPFSSSSSSFSCFFSSLPLPLPLRCVVLFLIAISVSPIVHVSCLTVAVNVSDTSYESPYFSFGVTSFDINGLMVRASPDARACTELDESTMTGKILWIEPFDCSIETKIRLCQRAGCIGGVSSSMYRVPGNEMWTSWDGSEDHSILKVPFVQVGRDRAEEIRILLKQYENSLKIVHPIHPFLPEPATQTNLTALSVRIRSSDSSNLWQDAYHSVYFTVFFQCLLGIAHILVFLLACYKFARYWNMRRERKHFSQIPLVCLGLEAACNFERAVYCLLDPLGAKQLIPISFRRALQSMSIPWTYTATLLLIFFWHEALAKHSEPIAFLSKLKRPFLISAISLQVIDITFIILDALYITDRVNVPVVQVVYACVSFGIASLLFLVSYRVIKRFRMEAHQRKDHIHIQYSSVANMNMRARSIQFKQFNHDVDNIIQMMRVSSKNVDTDNHPNSNVVSPRNKDHANEIADTNHTNNVNVDTKIKSKNNMNDVYPLADNDNLLKRVNLLSSNYANENFNDNDNEMMMMMMMEIMNPNDDNEEKRNQVVNERIYGTSKHQSDHHSGSEIIHCVNATDNDNDNETEDIENPSVQIADLKLHPRNHEFDDDDDADDADDIDDDYHANVDAEDSRLNNNDDFSGSEANEVSQLSYKAMGNVIAEKNHSKNLVPELSPHRHHHHPHPHPPTDSEHQDCDKKISKKAGVDDEHALTVGLIRPGCVSSAPVLSSSSVSSTTSSSPPSVVVAPITVPRTCSSSAVADSLLFQHHIPKPLRHHENEVEAAAIGIYPSTVLPQTDNSFSSPLAHQYRPINLNRVSPPLHALLPPPPTSHHRVPINRYRVDPPFSNRVIHLNSGRAYPYSHQGGVRKAKRGKCVIDNNSLLECRARHESMRVRLATRAKIVRMCQFLALSGIGMVVFMIVTASSPWTQYALDTPFLTIGAHWLLFAALLLIGASQVCAF